VIETVYIEAEVAEHPRAREILRRFPRAARVPIARYGEVFNRRAQSFRLQKARPAIILARKFDGFLLPTPAGYGMGAARNFYFSHMLNCPFDCRYCFLQGMYRSAHYVVFVNYEDYQQAMEERLQRETGEVHFFSGYDCDSLAFEPVTRFVESFLSFFARRPQATVELRTKSTQIEVLDRDPIENIVVAWSFTPLETSRALEHGVPPLERRVRAMEKVAERGWKIGLRLDPLIYDQDYRARYRRLLARIFQRIDGRQLHSVSLGPFRLPRGYFQTVRRLYPEEPLFSGPREERNRMVSYPRELEEELVEFCSQELCRHVPQGVVFPCRF
jgi:spore photoproduct lyase